MTTGEYRVGINFNPSADDKVAQIKRAAADLIDLIEAIPFPDTRDDMDDVELASVIDQSGEVARLKSLAMTNIENAAMWAVKAATKPAPEGK